MATLGKMTAFTKYAIFSLAFNVLVILWGVFLRASKSGDGCGEHWLTCHGELIPSAPEFKTIIEFSHRISTAIDGIVMLILLGWAIRIWYSQRNRQSRQILFVSAASMFFVLTEAAVGAGLVLTGNTAEAITVARPFWAIGHLLNTFILLAFLTLTVWFAAGERRFFLRGNERSILFIVIAVVGLILVGMSGSLAALSNMLFPSASITEGIAKDLSAASNIILRLRVSHPVMSILLAVYLIFLSGFLKQRSNEAKVSKWSNWLSILVLVQIAFGAATLLTLGPIVMQLGHLLIADLIWIVFVLLAANSLSVNADQPFRHDLPLSTSASNEF
jgi:cytochrome c oxidase assembly protein subunit 15